MDEEQRTDAVPLAGVILAGGKNIRMGVNKAFLTVFGQRIIDRTAALFNALFRQVILVTNTPLAYASLDLEIALDLIPANSPLVGIYTGRAGTARDAPQPAGVAARKRGEECAR